MPREVIRVQVGAAHRIVVLIDVALAVHDLEQVRAAAQRLVKRICRHCKEAYRPTPEEVEAFAPDPAPELLYRGRGCKECRNIGYAGRMALYEVFGIDAPVRRMVIEGVDADTIRRAAADAGMMTLRTAGFRRVVQGDTTLEEVMAVVADQD